MPIPKLEVTNPQAIELIRKIKSREIFIPVILWFKKNKSYLLTALVIMVLLIALIVGKKLSEQNPVPLYIPPDIEDAVSTPQVTPISEFNGLKEDIQNLNTDLPDPYIPTFDNAIDLEEPVI